MSHYATQRRRKAQYPNHKYKPDFWRYEQLKRDWIAANPNSTAEQYQSAMVAIAQKAGI